MSSPPLDPLDPLDPLHGLGRFPGRGLLSWVLRNSGKVLGLLVIAIGTVSAYKAASLARENGSGWSGAVGTGLSVALGFAVVTTSGFLSAFFGKREAAGRLHSSDVHQSDSANLRHELQLAQMSAQHHDTLLWSVTAVSFAIQAFMIKAVMDTKGVVPMAMTAGVALYLLGALHMMAGRFHAVKVYKYGRCKDIEVALGMNQHRDTPHIAMWSVYQFSYVVMALLWGMLVVLHGPAGGAPKSTSSSALQDAGVPAMLDAGLRTSATDAGAPMTVTDASVRMTVTDAGIRMTVADAGPGRALHAADAGVSPADASP